MNRLAAALFLMMGCSGSGSATADPGTPLATPPAAGQEVAVFAGGCFWCVESDFEGLKGVLSVESGYAGGKEKAPTYKQVSYGLTSHTEAIRVVYDPSKTTFDSLLESFWHRIDPTVANAQFCDKGKQYRTAVFYSNKEEKKAAEKTKVEVAEKLKSTVYTEVLPLGEFWVAEEYHQDYYKKNPAHYQRYRTGCGRDRRLKELWGDAAPH